MEGKMNYSNNTKISWYNLQLGNFQKDEKHIVKGFERLIKSLPSLELNALKRDMINISAEEAIDLARRINHSNCVITTDTETTRKVIITALKALNMNLLSLKQIATLHILDAAIRDFLTHATTFTYHEYVEEGKFQRNLNAFQILSHRIPCKTYLQMAYKDAFIPEGIEPNQLPDRMQLPVLKRFFAFTDDEWIRFCTHMEKKKSSEQLFYLINVPKFGCFSDLISKIQETLQLCHILDIPQKLSDGGVAHISMMVVPSFSMLQAVLKVKGETLGRKAPKLIPTYYLLTPEDYARTKEHEGIPLALYYPEANPLVRYNSNNPHFKAKIDGWSYEGPFAAIIHDFYHACREMAMAENVARARFHLALIAKKHKCDQKDHSSIPVSNILVDGELIFSYPKNKDTIFAYRFTDRAQKFGELFCTKMLEGCLHINLKMDFILDMVLNKEFWEKEFQLGRADLLEQDQKLYDVLNGNRDLGLIEELLAYGIPLEIGDKMRNGDLTLAHAAAKGYIKILQKLLSKGSDVDENTNQHDRALYQAIMNGKTEAIRVLLENKGSVNKPYKCGSTPLIQACGGGNLDIVELLLEHKASVNLKEESTGINPLGQAAAKGHVEIMKALLSKGADVNAKNSEGDTALHLAIYYDRVEAVKELLKQRDILIDEPNAAGDTPLMDACLKGNFEIVMLLLQHDASINFENSKTEMTPLKVAMSAGEDHIRIVSLLLMYHPLIKIFGYGPKITPLSEKIAIGVSTLMGDFYVITGKEEKYVICFTLFTKKMSNSVVKIGDGFFEGPLDEKGMKIVDYFLSKNKDGSLFYINNKKFLYRTEGISDNFIEEIN